jgi:hypothetical protein
MTTLNLTSPAAWNGHQGHTYEQRPRRKGLAHIPLAHMREAGLEPSFQIPLEQCQCDPWYSPKTRQTAADFTWHLVLCFGDMISPMQNHTLKGIQYPMCWLPWAPHGCSRDCTVSGSATAPLFHRQGSSGSQGELIYPQWQSVSQYRVTGSTRDSVI